MNDESWQILSDIAEEGGLKQYDLTDQRVTALLLAMEGLNYVKTEMGGAVRITKDGYAALFSHQQQLQNQCEQEAKNKAAKEEDRAYTAANNRKQRHHDYFVATFQVLTAWILGLVAEYYLQIVAFVIKLFEKLVSR